MSAEKRDRRGRAVSARAGRGCLTCALAIGFAASAMAQEPPKPEPVEESWLKRGELTGDWGGAREKLALEWGTKLEVGLTQFFHWVPEGEDERGYDYGGKLDVKVKTALGKWLWDNSSVDAHVELRYGDTPLFNGGTLIPTNAALIFPESEGTHAKLSSLYFHAALRREVRRASRSIQHPRPLQRAPFHGR